MQGRAERDSCAKIVCRLINRRGEAAMQQVAEWLGKLGLEQYAQRFAENDINLGILPDLTDQDLKELGVASLGHRRQLLRAIAELNKDNKSPSTPAISVEALLLRTTLLPSAAKSR